MSFFPYNINITIHNKYVQCSPWVFLLVLSIKALKRREHRDVFEGGQKRPDIKMYILKYSDHWPEQDHSVKNRI